MISLADRSNSEIGLVCSGGEGEREGGGEGSSSGNSKLNPFTSLSGPLEPALISSFCSVKRMRVIDSPWTGH